jgi:hypothetical protein
MAWPPGEHFDTLIDKARQVLTGVHIIRYDVSLRRALIDLEGQWGSYRTIVSEVHRTDGSVRYAYYLLDRENRLVHGFDNSPDTLAVKLQYGVDWKSHFHEEVPHQHDANRNLALTPVPMTFDAFIEWLTESIEK